MKLTLPNILTILRLLAAPGLAIMFLYFSRPVADWCALILFMGAAITDWFDGHLARSWQQITKLGTMLDPIADKAMVLIALTVIIGFSSWSPWLVLPATVIVFREVFVSGLREFLGDTAGMLKVTKLAKWKTTAQMVAIAVLFAQGIFEHYLVVSSIGMGDEIIGQVLRGEVEDVMGLRWKYQGMVWSGQGGLALLWVAAALTLITGWDYFRKAMPHLREDR
ncbi:CDP-diacylglycerol--glycerol-3-phosphate 3-phosphatidyltransferase [Antarctobacter jejuensis]|uniref:CDP-diacylglycerol--glycerol-3-phosphate 3-phosphatidyltransferase n=1 Tax=Antarctobacter jejuensis TaxID=1439938 RepID=UPI003FD48E3A